MSFDRSDDSEAFDSAREREAAAELARRKAWARADGMDPRDEDEPEADPD